MLLVTIALAVLFIGPGLLAALFGSGAPSSGTRGETMPKTFLVKSISTDTVQYRLVQTGTLWHAERHVLTEDGKWLLSWATDMWPNQYGARMAIGNAFDV